jgi:formylglycine-generating enzyme required for sulfatase activity
MFGSVCVFFSLGWATYLLANQAVGTEDTGAAVAHWVRTLALAGIVVVDLAAIGAYIFCTHPRDFGLTARPQDNFVNSLGMGMVKTSDGYWVGKSEVRQAEFQDLMGYNPSFSKDPNKPVEMISADEALTFCEKLTELDRARGTLPKGFVYTLPTETMWRKYVADARIEDAILSRGTIRAAPEDVGTLPPNRLGLHDVRGNVAEYCLDWYDVARKYRVIRGGSYRNRNPEYWSIDNRAGAAGDRSSDIGFRVVLVPTRASPGGNH